MFWDFTFVSYSDIEPNIIFFFLRSLIIELLPLYIIFFEGHSIVYNCYNFFFQPTASKDVDLRAVKVPPIIYAERPFMVNLCLTNQTDKTVGPFEVFLAPSMTSEERVVLVNGLQKLVSCFICTLFFLLWNMVRLGALFTNDFIRIHFCGDSSVYRRVCIFQTVNPQGLGW